MEVEMDAHKVDELREWLRLLGKPCSGSKAQLVQRLNAIDHITRGQCPNKRNERENNGDADHADDAVDVSPLQEENINFADVVSELEVQMEGMRKQIELLSSENTMLKRDKTAVAEKNKTVESSNMSISVLKELITEYDGSIDAKVWAKQLENLSKVYALDDDTKRIILISKLKGKAQQWLHSMPDFVMKSADALMDQMVEMFGVRTNVLKLRKNFEARKWRAGESFAHYCNDKCALANEIKMTDEELLEYLIEGIPVVGLRNQANLLCVNTKAQLLQAFSKVELKPMVSATNMEIPSSTNNVRCFNCYMVGHYAGDCKKPKRERGSCFSCGKMGHRVAECPEKKKEVLVVDEELENYVRNFVIFVKSGFNNSFSAECLIDSGSPVNFIKIKILKDNNIHYDKECSNLSYHGINKTKLKIFGKFECFIILKNKIVNFMFLVVADESMSFDAVLGRSFMKASKIKLVFDNEVCDKGVPIQNFDYDQRELEKSYDNSYDNYDYENIGGNYDCENKIESNYEEVLKKYENDLNNIDDYDYENINDYSNYENDINSDHEKIIDNYENIINDCDEENLDSNVYENVKCFDTKKINEEEMLNDNVNEKTKFEIKSLNTVDNAVREIFAIDFESAGVNFSIGEHLSQDIKNNFVDLFNKHYVNQFRPEEPRTKCEMKLILENAKPFHFSARRLSYHEKNELQKLLDEYLAKGYIRPSCSEYASPIVLVKKKTGELRMCVDFRTLNKITAKDNYPLPMIDDLLDKLANKKYFTKLDLKNGFFHVFMHEDSVKYTAFVTPFGLFEWLRMSFGLKNAPAVFQRFVNSVFADMIRENKLIVYMDDILVATDELNEHFEILKEVFNRLVQNKLELRIDKCDFLQRSVKYLGYVVDKDGIKPDSKGVEAIQNFPIPQNVHDVQRFLGLGSYFRRFIANFSSIAKPLYDLLKKDKAFVFQESELESFETIKRKLSEYPILAIFDPRHETELHCDASKIGFGAILLQRKSDNKMHPVFYFSKRTTEVESRYHSFELEMLAIIYALKRFRIYLDGRPFKIVTDCNSLTLALSKKEINPRISRWALELQNFDYSLEHRPNSRMQHVDALSRSTYVMILETNTLEENLIICQNKDENLCNIKKSLEKSESKIYELRNGILYKKIDKNTILFYVPLAMEKHVLHKYHNEMGHVGVNKTVDLIKKAYWFPKMKLKVENHIQNCLQCIAFSNKNRVEGYVHNIPKSVIPFDVIHIDHFGPINNSNRSKKHILVVIDAGTKFVRLYDTKTTNTKEVIIALKDYFRSYSRPRILVSDRGSCFTSSEFSEFLTLMNVRHIKIATGSPQANGQVERVNRSLGPMLAKLVETREAVSWDKVVEDVEFTLNNTVCRSIGQCPSTVLFGIAQRGKVTDMLKENFLDNLNSQEQNFDKIRNDAKIKQEKMQTYNENYVNKTRLSPKKFNVGDYVMVRNFDSHTSGPKKLIPKFKGPYEITKVLRNDRYIVKDVENIQQTQIPYKGVWAISNIRPWLDGRNW